MRTRRSVHLALSVAISLVALAAVPPLGLAATVDDLAVSTADSVSLAGRVGGDKALTSHLAETSRSLLARTDATPVPVLIKLDYDSVATYAGGIAGLAPTSPQVTGRELTGRTAAERRYERYIAGQEAAFVAALERRVPAAEVGEGFRVVYGGVAAIVPANRVRTIVRIADVVAVQLDRKHHVLTDASPEFIGATSLYPELGGDAQAGQGVIYGNLDTGVWPEHPSFEDLGNLPAPPGPARECNFGDNPVTPEPDPFVCGNKLIGGAHFTDTYDALIGDDVFAGTARDGEGHGTHTASTSAGNVLASAPVFGVERGPVQGIAPGAYVMEYKVCGPQGCFSSDSAAAVEQAILDGVDVINFSISGGTNPFTDPVELAFLDAYAAGVFVAASAGNEGPGAATVNHVSPWVTTVAASTQTREFRSTLSLEADGGASASLTGVSITAGIDTATSVVLAGSAPGYEDALCLEPAPAGALDGLIVGCERGIIARVEKGFNVLQGGAAGMILYNPSLADVETDNHWLPAIHLADGTDFVAFMDENTGVTGTFTAGEKADGQGDVMAAFSSRGPGGNFIKPDVTAPGVQILAGHTPAPASIVAGPPGEHFQAIAGTSMSSPHTAGAAILLMALDDSFSPGQVRSALMTTALTDVVKEDLTTSADPFDFGSGRIDLTVAGTPGVTFDESAVNMALLGNDPVNAVHLNIPSVNAPVMPGRVVTTRTAENTSGSKQRFAVETTSPAGSSIVVQPRKFNLNTGASIDLTISITSDESDGQQRFGEIRLVPKSGTTLHLPVAFVPTQGGVNLVSGCSPDTIELQGISSCEITAQNNSFTDTTVDLDTTLTKHLLVEGVTGATQVGPRHVRLHDVELAGATPGVPSVDPGSLAGYIPLDSFPGVTPFAIGDEEIINFDVPAFVYGGQTYTSIGVDSNGYVIAGGGTAEDNECCNLPSGPDPARPNNMLAPFWTDLDGTEAEGIFAVVLTDGVNSWIVIEFRLNVFGTTDLRVFQTWIGIDGTEDITYAYDPADLPADPNAQPFLVGAENILGQGDMEAVLPTEDLRVTSTDPVPGASVTYVVDVRGIRPGLGVVTTQMTSPDLPGTTIVTSEVQVG
jgi:hypothetical protein